MADQDDQQEPSMEDILASIRKILSEDEEGGEDASDAAEAEDVSEAAPEPEPEEDDGEDDVASQADIDALFDDPPAPVEEDDPVEDEPEPEEDDAGPLVFDEADDEDEDEVLELTDDMVAEPPPPAPAPEPIPEPQPAAAAMQTAGDGLYGLVAPPVETEAAKKVSELTAALMAERGVRLGNVGVTLEELTRSLLKPMIKEWLDENLPFMTERIVQAEIQRIVHKGERGES